MITIPCIEVFPCGTALAWWKGDWVWCVSLVPCRSDIVSTKQHFFSAYYILKEKL